MTVPNMNEIHSSMSENGPWNEKVNDGQRTDGHPVQGRMLTGFARGAVTEPKPGPSQIGVVKVPRMRYMYGEI